MIRCPTDGRKFGGEWGYRLAHPTTLDRCRTEDEMRAAGLHRNRRGWWVRRAPSSQAALDFRAGSRVRQWFGKPYRALSAEERAEYRRRLSATSDAPSAVSRRRAQRAQAGVAA